MPRILALLSLAGLVLVAPSPAQDVVTMGHFVTTPTGAARGFDITGRAMMVRRDNGSTDVYTMVLGLQPNTTYDSHVHDLPCGVASGGGHYKIDPNVAGAVQSNEIWPTLAADANGEAFGFASVQHLARPEAQSVVVHDFDGARIACADLLALTHGAQVTQGELTTLPGGAVQGLNIQGRAQMVRSHGTTYVTVRATGLQPATTYPVHVHALPCSVNEGGGHYKIDPTVSGTVASNEIWPGFTTDASGVGAGMAAVSHVARPEAQSVVIHDPSGTKIACADLSGPAPVPFLTTGDAIVTEVGLQRGFTGLKASAAMLRTASGRTLVHLSAQGLAPRTTYTAHVHDRPCRLGGGGHYKFDPSIAGTFAWNELWLNFRTRNNGSGHAFALDLQISRPEAATVVIHDVDGARIACIDLD